MKKKLFAIALALIVAMPTVTVARDALKESSAHNEALRKELSKKASKDAKKEAKRLTKEGWQVKAGALPLEKQLDRAFMMREDVMDDMSLKYIMGTSTATAQTFDAAAQQARINARADIAQQIETDITQIIDASIANDQLTSEEAASVTKSKSQTKAFVSQKLSNLTPVTEIYRKLPNGNIEVQVTVAYSKETARKMALDAIRKNLENDIPDLGDKLGM